MNTKGHEVPVIIHETTDTVDGLILNHVIIHFVFIYCIIISLNNEEKEKLVYVMYFLISEWWREKGETIA